MCRLEYLRRALTNWQLYSNRLSVVAIFQPSSTKNLISGIPGSYDRWINNMLFRKTQPLSVIAVCVRTHFAHTCSEASSERLWQRTIFCHQLLFRCKLSIKLENILNVNTAQVNRLQRACAHIYVHVAISFR